jgi:putative MATE family efflux protein
MTETVGRDSVRPAEALNSELISLAWPILLANILQTLYQMINMFWVGSLDTKSVAAVAACYPMIGLLSGLYGGLLAASFILVAQYAGARNQSRVNCVTAQSLILMATMSVLFAGGGFAASSLLLRLMGISADVIDPATRYLQVSLLGGSFVFAVSLYGSIMRGLGEVKVVLYLTALGVMLNMALDPLFIFGVGPIPAGGVTGAAYATLASQGITAAVALHRLSGSRGVKLVIADFVPDFALLKRLVVLGAPVSLEACMDPIALIILTGLVASFGTIAVAANGVGLRLFAFAAVFLSSVSAANGILVGRAMGAGDTKRGEAIAVRSTWMLFGVSMLLGLLEFSFAIPLVRLFVPADPALIQEGARAVRLMALSLGFVGVWMGLASTFSSAGDTLFPMIATVVIYWTVEIPAAWALSRHTALGSGGVWMSYPVSASTAMIVGMLWFKVGRWKGIDLTGAPKRK